MGLKIICFVGIAWCFFLIIGGLGIIYAFSLIRAGLLPAPAALLTDEMGEIALTWAIMLAILPGVVFSFLLYLLYQMNRKGWMAFMTLQIILIIYDAYSIINGFPYDTAEKIEGLIFVIALVSAYVASATYLWNRRGIFK